MENIQHHHPNVPAPMFLQAVSQWAASPSGPGCHLALESYELKHLHSTILGYLSPPSQPPSLIVMQSNTALISLKTP